MKATKLGLLIKEHMKRTGHNITSLSKATDYNHAYLAHIIGGRKDTYPAYINKLSDALELPNNHRVEMQVASLMNSTRRFITIEQKEPLNEKTVRALGVILNKLHTVDNSMADELCRIADFIEGCEEVIGMAEVEKLKAELERVTRQRDDAYANRDLHQELLAKKVDECNQLRAAIKSETYEKGSLGAALKHGLEVSGYEVNVAGGENK